MDYFQYTLELEKINKATTRTFLKNQLVKYNSVGGWCWSNSSYNLRIYNIHTSIIEIQTSVYAQKLCKACVNRYKILYGSTKGLPAYTSHLDEPVTIQMTLEQAYKWIKENQ